MGERLSRLFAWRASGRRGGSAVEAADPRAPVREWNALAEEAAQLSASADARTAARLAELRRRMRRMEDACVAAHAARRMLSLGLEWAAERYAGQDLAPALENFDDDALMALKARVAGRIGGDARLVVGRFLDAHRAALDAMLAGEARALGERISGLAWCVLAALYESAVAQELIRPGNPYVAANLRDFLVTLRHACRRSDDPAVSRDEVVAELARFGGARRERVADYLGGAATGLAPLYAEVMAPEAGALAAEMAATLDASFHALAVERGRALLRLVSGG